MTELLIPILAGLSTGILGFLLGRHRDLERHNRETRATVYIEYMSAQAALTRPWSQPIVEKFLRQEGLNGDEWGHMAELFERFSNAHSKVLIYGSKSVVERLSAFYDFRDGTASPEGKIAYAELIAAMRKDSNSEQISNLAELTDNIVLDGPARRRRELGQELLANAKEIT
ncbi:MAG: hypothetical protein ACKVGV_07000 [Sphingomonadales bacterium]